MIMCQHVAVVGVVVVVVVVVILLGWTEDEAPLHSFLTNFKQSYTTLFVVYFDTAG
jgi:hypothetical protein